MKDVLINWLSELASNPAFVSALIAAITVMAKLAVDRSKSISEMREKWSGELRHEISVLCGALREYHHHSIHLNRKLVGPNDDDMVELRKVRKIDALSKAVASYSKILVMLPNKGDDGNIITGFGEGESKDKKGVLAKDFFNSKNIMFISGNEYIKSKLSEILSSVGVKYVSPALERKLYNIYGLVHKDDARDALIRRAKRLMSRCYSNSLGEEFSDELNQFSQISSFYIDQEWRQIKVGEKSEQRITKFGYPILAFLVMFVLISSLRQGMQVWEFSESVRSAIKELREEVGESYRPERGEGVVPFDLDLKSDR